MAKEREYLEEIKEMRARIEQSSKAIDKISKENLGLKKMNAVNEKAKGVQE